VKGRGRVVRLTGSEPERERQRGRERPDLRGKWKYGLLTPPAPYEELKGGGGVLGNDRWRKKGRTKQIFLFFGFALYGKGR